MQQGSAPLDEWLAQLETCAPEEINLGLERVQLLLERLELQLPQTVFHVAGTNGKGSSVVMLEAILLQAGKTVGAYTSPHIERYNERIRVNGIDASDARIIAAFERVAAARGDVPLTYFEFGTLAALVVFAEERVDVAVLEIGMGGRLDAVNAVEPTAGLITSIGLDHCAWLGNDIETIAVEKAGVMRTGKAVVFAAPDMPQAIARCARSCGALLFRAGIDYRWAGDGQRWSWTGFGLSVADLVRPSLPGDIQLQNAAGVLALLAAAGYREWLRPALLNAALGKLRLAGRLQAVGATWLLDVAHNAAAAEVLARELAGRGDRPRRIAILGMLDDKDVEGVVAPLSPLVDSWIAVTADSHRAIAADELARRVANATNRPCLIAASLDMALARAREIAADDRQVLVTGSFYLVGPVLQRLNGLYSPR